MHEHSKNLDIIELCVHFVFNESETRICNLHFFHSVKLTNGPCIVF